MAEGFTQRGYSITLLGMNSIGQENSYEDDSDQASKYPVVIPYTDNPPPRNKDANRWNRMRGEAVGYMRRYFESIDLADTILITLHVYVMEHILETGVPIGGDDGLAVLGMYHNSFDSCRDVGDLGRVLRSYSRANRFYALTEADRDKYAVEGLTNASYMYNPVELLSRPSILSIEERPKKVVYVGRYAVEKRVPKLVECWAKVASDFPDWKFEIYGVGPDAANIAKSILENHVSDSVTLMGKTQNPEQVLANSRLMMMASDFEGLPVVVVEAGLVGTPTLATNCAPGMEVLIENEKTGVLVEDRDYYALAVKLSNLLRDSEALHEMSVASASYMERFSISRIADEWEREFTEMDLI
ncbi:hypothetical protein CYJ46_11385 [Corynebacterium coyleae]|nr:hypothetical protein CYJ46_11385 [Corynebacterium coyleae]